MANEIETLLGLAEPEAKFFDVSGSLDYIDSLGKSVVNVVATKADVLAARDAAVISSAVFDDVEAIPQALPADNRRFNFNQGYDPGELSPGASRLIDYGFDQPDEYERWEEIHKRVLRPNPFARPKGGEQKVHQRRVNQFRFSEPDKLEICLKRKIRREIMHAFGVSGVYWPKRRYTPFSFVRC